MYLKERFPFWVWAWPVPGHWADGDMELFLFWAQVTIELFLSWAQLKVEFFGGRRGYRSRNSGSGNGNSGCLDMQGCRPRLVLFFLFCFVSCVFSLKEI